MNSIDYGVVYRSMVVMPEIELRGEDEIVVEISGLVFPVEKVHGNCARRVSDYERGQNFDEFC